MPSTPWVVQRGKRKQPTTTPVSRKRVRIIDDVGERTSSRSKSKDQRTLTQIQWVNSPDANVEDDLDLQETATDGRDNRRAAKPRRSMLKKRNSTLTQMDWLGAHQQADHDDMMDDTALLPIVAIGSHDQIAQIDGTYDSPRKKRPRKQDTVKAQPRSSSPSTPERETQDYHPTQVVAVPNPTVAEPKTKRRKSARIASKVLSDADENFDYMNQALSSREDATVRSSLSRRPQLEIMDSMDMGEEITPMSQYLQPQTPRRQREIPSSQTPETVTRYRKFNSQRIEPSPSRKFGRTPLKEKSANVPPKSYVQPLESAKSLLKGRKLSPQRSKICVLKVPNRGLLRRSGRVEDSQQDIYSLPLTSSSSEVDGQPYHESSKTPVAVQTTKDRLQIEIPATSQRTDSSDREMPSSPPGVDTQESLPELSDLIPSRKPNDARILHGPKQQVSQHRQADGQDSVLVKDFGRPNSRRGLNPLLMENESGEHRAADTIPIPVNVEASPERPKTPSLNTLNTGERDHDTGSDFGSPIANDTQFNAGLLQRTSSPDLMVESEHAETPTQIIPKMGPPPLPKSNQQHESGSGTILPTPRLIGRAHFSNKGNQPGSGNSPNETEIHPSIDEYDSYATVATVPISANVDQLTSSSPPLPPVRTTNDRGIYPASMPRPSQISTQDPTQNYLSSLPQPTQHHTQMEPITIKDSSSTRLTQIPKYESQSQGLNLQLVPGLDDEIDDLDLDPSSAAYAVQSARKPTGLLRNQTGSSLRSIHPSSESSRNRRDATPTSSSPTRQESRLQTTADEQTPKIARSSATQQEEAQSYSANDHDAVHGSDETSSPISSPDPPDLKRKYDPLPGFDNETQSNFTQSGHITAAYIHRQRESGKWPDWFVPEPFQLPNFKRPKKRAATNR